MKLIHWTAVAAGALAVAACEQGPTRPDSLQASFDQVDPVVATFAASQGLPGGPIGLKGGAPHMGGMAFAGAPGSAADGRGPGAAFPDDIKLTDAQRTQIQALVDAFVAANKTDLDAMKAAHTAARDAMKAGKTREEVKALLEAAKPAAERVKAASAALRTAIRNVLTQAQRDWLDAHKPEKPPRTP